jgi:hypothetical protein
MQTARTSKARLPQRNRQERKANKMGERVSGGNIDQSSGAWGWNQVPGLRNPNPISSSADVQSTVNSAPQTVAFNQPNVAPNAGKPIKVSGGSGSTGNPAIDVNRVVSGQVPGSSVVFNSRG